MAEPQVGHAGLVPLVNGRTGGEAAANGAAGDGTGRGVAVVFIVTLEVGTLAPSKRRSCSARTRSSRDYSSAASQRTREGNASSRRFAVRSVVNPLRIDVSSLAFWVA